MRKYEGNGFIITLLMSWMLVFRGRIFLHQNLSSEWVVDTLNHVERFSWRKCIGHICRLSELAIPSVAAIEGK